MGPLEVFSGGFSGERSHGRDQDDLSRALSNIKVSSFAGKPLPELPPARTPSQIQHQLQHQRARTLPQSVSLQYMPPVKRTPHFYQQASTSQHRLEPSPPYQASIQTHNAYDRERPLSIPVFRLNNRLPNPWELAASAPPAAFDPALLTPPRPIRPLSAPVLTPPKTARRRGKEIISDPTLPPGRHQCWGIKRDGTRCSRRVGASTSSSPAKGRGRTPSKSPSPTKSRIDWSGANGNAIVVSDSEEDFSDGNSSQDDERREYCHQHSKEINKTGGFILPGLRRNGSKSRARVGDGTYVDFDAFLVELSKETPGEDQCKAKLRTAMTRVPSEVDWVQKGFIYIYELRDRSTESHIALKVGRAINVFKRFEEWRSQCQSKSPLLRSFFPRAEGSAFQSVLPGASSSVAASDGVLLSHKWERLIHIELSHLGKRLDDKCSDCGAKHKEIFLMPRDIGYDGTKKVVEKWLRFVRLVVRDGLGI